jgi:AcrR family transcriptional regulator
MGKGDQTREAVLRHALALSSRIGLQALSIGRLAEELEMSKSGLFGHFKSKESLLSQVLDLAAQEFLDDVVRPAFREPAGEPRVRKLFRNWVEWTRSNRYSGGCPFMQFSFELDDQPGQLRDELIRQQHGWMGILAESARRAMAEGHFRNDLDVDQFAYELQSLMLGYHHAARLMRDEKAEIHVLSSFETLISQARAKE